MKVLLVIDGSSHAEMAVSMVEALRLPSRTAITVLAVIPEHVFLGGLTLRTLRSSAAVDREAQERKAAEFARSAEEKLSGVRLKPTSMVRHGNPTEVVLRAADETDSSLIVMGAKGQADSPRFPLGATAQKVIRHARCSVLLVRNETANVRRILLATDGSRHSDAAVRFLLDLPAPRRAEILVMTALESDVAALIGMPTLDLDANRRIVADLRSAEEEQARKITSGTEEQFRSKQYRTGSTVVRGRPTESILMLAAKHDPDIIAMGARGLTGIPSLLLGSVAERVARHAGCSVLIARAGTPPDGSALAHARAISHSLA